MPRRFASGAVAWMPDEGRVQLPISACALHMAEFVSAGGETQMNRLGLLAGVAALGLVPLGVANAAPAAPPAGEGLSLIQPAQFVYRGREYCFYRDGWHGPGFYWCGFNWRRGRGWGGPPGWNGWYYEEPPIYSEPPPPRYRQPPVYEPPRYRPPRNDFDFDRGGRPQRPDGRRDQDRGSAPNRPAPAPPARNRPAPPPPAPLPGGGAGFGGRSGLPQQQPQQQQRQQQPQQQQQDRRPFGGGG
jgi:hypothetical protein